LCKIIQYNTARLDGHSCDGNKYLRPTSLRLILCPLHSLVSLSFSLESLGWLVGQSIGWSLVGGWLIGCWLVVGWLVSWLVGHKWGKMVRKYHLSTRVSIMLQESLCQDYEGVLFYPSIRPSSPLSIHQSIHPSIHPSNGLKFVYFGRFTIVSCFTKCKRFKFLLVN
jgi:hypothetical protein